MADDKKTRDDLRDDPISADGADAAFAGDDRDTNDPASDSLSPEQQLLSDMLRLRAEAAEANDRAIRTHAELENYRKRARRELEDEKRYASLNLLRDLLQVLDNLNRAIESAQKTEQAEQADKSTALTGLLAGVQMVALQLNTCLDQHQCRVIADVGTVFDPHLHEAIAQEPSTEHPAGTITRVARKGYSLHDRVVRPAQVLVSIGPPPTASH